jgi:hypothetical protein
VLDQFGLDSGRVSRWTGGPPPPEEGED